MLVVAAIDRRVKAVVCQVPMVSGHDNFRALVRADLIAGFQAVFNADRAARFRGDPPAMVPVVAEDPLAPCALPTRDSWEWFSETGKTRAPSWRNEVTLRSVEMFSEYEPIAYLPYISPTPLLMQPAIGDHLTPCDLAVAAYEKAREPKKLNILPGGHFDAYVEGLRRLLRAGPGLVRAAPGGVVMGRLTDKVAVVTGSSSGNGRAIALALAAEGAAVVCSDIRREAREGGYETDIDTPTDDVIRRTAARPSTSRPTPRTTPRSRAWSRPRSRASAGST